MALAEAWLRLQYGKSRVKSPPVCPEELFDAINDYDISEAINAINEAISDGFRCWRNRNYLVPYWGQWGIRVGHVLVLYMFDKFYKVYLFVTFMKISSS